MKLSFKYKRNILLIIAVTWLFVCGALLFTYKEQANEKINWSKVVGSTSETITIKV